MTTEVLRYESAQSVELLFGEEHAGHDIGVGEWQKSDQSLYTSGAAPCIVLVGYNRESRIGLLGHYDAASSSRPVPGSTQTKAERFQEAVDGLEELGNPCATEVWLGGGSPFIYRGEDVVEPDRKFTHQRVAEKLRTLKIAETALEIRWSEANRAIDVEIDCADGILVVHEYRLEHWSPEEMRRRLKQING